MTVRQPRYSKEEFALRGDNIYETQIRLPLGAATPTQVEEGNHGKIVAITSRRGYANDIETGTFEVGNDIVTASEHLLAKLPDAQTWFIGRGAI
jgi:hypothetical protein